MPRPAVLLAVLICLGGSASAVEGAKAAKKLVWSYPCNFAYNDGSTRDERPDSYQCSYMRAHIRNAADQFNGLPTLAAQESFLSEMKDDVEDKYDSYVTSSTAILKATDPSNVKSTVPSERLKQFMAYRTVVYSSGTAACQPFEYEKMEDESYLIETQSSYPKSWKSCMQRFYDRGDELKVKIDALQADAVATAKSVARARIAASMKGDDGDHPSSDETRQKLGALFDNDRGAAAPGGQFSSIEQGGLTHLQGDAAGKMTPGYEGPKAEAQAAPPVPESKEQRIQRDYFSRGYEEGMKRLGDDVELEADHATGQSRTIGNPYGRADLVFDQTGGTCGLAVQAEALRARGQDVDMKSFVKEAQQKGVYTEILMQDGTVLSGGTSDANSNKMLEAHHVASEPVAEAKPEDLDAALRKSGDAIVGVDAKKFWNDESLPDNSGHAIYVTGEEVDKNGKVLGYYVNDTGTGEAARYVHKDDFLRAWDNTMVRFDK